MFVHKDQYYVIKMLRKQMAELKEEKESVKRYTEDSYGSRTGELEPLEKWSKSATTLIEMADKLVNEDKEHWKNKRPIGLCLNPKSPYQLRKKAEQICMKIAAHVQNARRFDVPLPYRQERVVADHFVYFKSRSTILDGIMGALQSPCINKIGVYGEPGILDFPRIQDEIARGLGLDPVSNELTSLEASNSNQARLIEKLVILEDVWESGLSLELLGIKEKYNLSYKILLTSRDENVVSLLSEVQFEIGKLALEEAWDLFEKIADDPYKSLSLPFYAIEIAKKCEQLPIAVATVANALRRNLIEWKTTLGKLQSPPSNLANSSQILTRLHLVIEFLYNGLKSDDLQQTFLLCSLLGQNATIQNLLKYGIGLGLFAGVKSIEEARAQVLSLVTKLRDSSLLLDSGSSSYFDMHDLVQEFAISTASKEQGVLALGEDAPIDWSNTQAMESIKWIYLSNGDTGPLPDEVKCPKLTFFHLSKKEPSLASLPNWFRDKERLRVLSLSKLNFMSIPSPISLPKSLCTFCLDQVELGKANIGTMMAELENLQVLSLAGSDIKELPKQMGQLAKLKLLDLSDCTKLKVIPPGILSSLSELEELYMRNSFDQWAEGIEEHKIQNASLAELKHSKLTAIEVCIICDIQKIPEGLFSENLARFKVFLGDRWNYWDSSWESSKLLILKLDARISFECSVRKLLKKTNELHLQGRIGAENVVSKLDEEGFQELKYLVVQDALEIKNIFCNSVSSKHAFPVLEVLFLRNLENMEKICHGLLGAASFRKLRLITIEYCNKMKNLFSSSIAKQLQQLQEIRVKDCSDMEEIVDDKEQESGNDAEEHKGHNFVELIALRSLRLQHLPKLIAFNSSCGTTRLFNEKVVLLNLEELRLSSIMVENIICNAFVKA
ncbi:hypothetical protein SLEP1_g36723 [Rubroshorea leprosula]|uniref:NB-ARC domain-containing protein n=1 Tax=Rubroshorea leprosula TaxID=152421 RepID=A0AAV5KSD7_9ROSI|nr:hypothetical protein SLEP1_g36723 [Rubroshorea leprosula]